MSYSRKRAIFISACLLKISVQTFLSVLSQFMWLRALVVSRVFVGICGCCRDARFCVSTVVDGVTEICRLGRRFVQRVISPHSRVVMNVLPDAVMFFGCADNSIVIPGLPSESKVMLTCEFCYSDFEASHDRCQILWLWSKTVSWHLIGCWLVDDQNAVYMVWHDHKFI